jgi:tetratricopeptide (TPR) repeat protein
MESSSHLVANARERLEAGDAHGAVHLLTDVVRSGEAFADAHNLLGLALALVGRREDALVEFGRALDLNPRYVDALLNRAVVLSDLGRDGEAAATFHEAQQLGTVDHTGFAAPIASRLANLHAELGEAYVEAGSRPRAIAQFEAAAALRPEFVDLRYRLARLYIEEGLLERAHEELDAILARRPTFVDARVSLGMVCYLRQDTAGARAAWEECARMAPRDARVTAYLALLSRLNP